MGHVSHIKSSKRETNKTHVFKTYMACQLKFFQKYVLNYSCKTVNKFRIRAKISSYSTERLIYNIPYLNCLPIAIKNIPDMVDWMFVVWYPCYGLLLTVLNNEMKSYCKTFILGVGEIFEICTSVWSNWQTNNTARWMAG